MFMPKPSVSIVPPVSELTAVAVAPVDDPVPATSLAVIALFSDELAKLAFPDVDLAVLRRQADEIRAQAVVVARAREALEVATAALAIRTTALADSANRGIAYARIYADAHPERQALKDALDALAPPARTTANLTASGKRRGRPPRQSAELMFAVETPATES